ncbi:hypothetical protein [Pseudomonas sp.]|uniref:hypothetical protein n=1 Tax=Pseudomonas sp. TaxID=306 RepID=UPI0025DB3612|nr:hypothetical protein [Pseudomonas sp.]
MQNSVSEFDARTASRHSTDHHVTAQQSRLGELGLSIASISAAGFMATNVPALRKGDRIAMRLPIIGWIEAHMVWQSSGRAGFHFERMIRADDLNAMLGAFGPNESSAEDRWAA